ncbi:MAG TPA: MFS transporter [Gaiella sp.]|jgi:MFS family permease|nr:MFS transporter [Gaiella sp.]
MAEEAGTGEPEREAESRARASLRALGAVFASPPLRRLQLAWAGSILGDWAYLVALGVYAYNQGGASAVGLVGLIRLVPGALIAPFSASFVDRFPRVAVMVVADVVRFGLMAAAAVVIATDGPAPVVYALVALTSATGTVFRPAQAALLPSLVASPAELTAANVASSTLESVGTFLGPALGGLLLAVSSPAVVFAANGFTFLWSAVLVLGLRRRDPGRPSTEAAAAGAGTGGVMAGITTIAREPNLRTLVGLYAAQTLVAGALNVLVVVTAFELLDLDDSGVGLLYAAVGVGGLVGGFVALILAARGRLARDFALGLVLFGLPLILLGGVPVAFVAVVALGVLGIGNSIVDVNALTIMQRVVPDAVLGRALGALQGLLRATLGIGALVAPGLVALVGPEWALVVTGAVLPTLALLTRPRLRAIDREASAPEAAGLLRRVPLLASLPEPVLERLAREAVPVSVAAGVPIVREGEIGDRFYVVGSGTVSILGRTFGPGSGFGEIALLRDVPRTATAVAVTDVELVALEREPFVAAVTGHAPSAAAADTVVAARLGALSAGTVPV